MKQLEILNIAIDCLTEKAKDKKVELEKIEAKLADLTKEREELTGKIVNLHINKKVSNA